LNSQDLQKIITAKEWDIKINNNSIVFSFQNQQLNEKVIIHKDEYDTYSTSRAGEPLSQKG
jgi:hypothetical protein